MKVNAKHRLCEDDGSEVEFVESPNYSKKREIVPEILVMHYTAGGSASGSIMWLCDRQAQASAHLVIGRDGDVTQLVDFNRKAWHAGVSRWNTREGVNAFSIGIELANAGVLVGGPGEWRTSFERPVRDEDVVIAQHKNDGKERAWERYSEAQLDAASLVAATLVRKYKLADIVGHEDIAPGRKLDPGPAFPLASFKAMAMGRSDDTPVFYQTTSVLNIRVGPGSQYEKLASGPLPEGARLDVLAEEGVWRQVDVLDTVNGDMDLNGWVHSRYIRRA